MTFSLLFYENDGILRGYVIVSTFLGMFLYDRLVSQSVFAVLKNVGRWITMKRRTMITRKKEGKRGRKPK